MSGLRVDHLSASYARTRVLDDVSITVDTGQVVVVLGANGAGKTTLLRAITGGTTNTGAIEYDGNDIVGAERSSIARLGIGHVPQGRGTFTTMSVEENLRLGAHRRSDSADEDLEAAFSRWPVLRERRTQTAGNLSGGEQQMLAVARALMGRPSLLLLDEPSLGLAPLIVQGLFQSLADLKAETAMSMLIVEQNANLALAIADHAYVLENGRVVHDAPADQIADDEQLRRAYLGV